MRFEKLEPKIYKIVRKSGKDSVGYDLVLTDEKYTIRKKLYGIVNKLIPRVSRLITKGLFNHISIIATGGKGLGKTTAMNKICNQMLEAGIPVIALKYVEPDIGLIDFLSDFRNVCIYIDEFAKYFSDTSLQDKMLTLLNRKDDYYNIFILGENERSRISNYILDRMERARYNLHLSRITNDDLKEYCIDNSLSKDVTNNLLSINQTSSKISYDTLDAIALEARIFPELNFDELVEVMNVKGILGIPIMNLLEVVLEDSDERYVSKAEISYGYDKLRYSRFMEEGYTLSLLVKLKKIKTDKEKEETDTNKSSIPQQSHFYPGMGYGGNGDELNISLRMNSSDVVNIDDLDGVVTIRVEEQGYKFKVLLNTRIVNLD
jgi:hypothetical protein